ADIKIGGIAELVVFAIKLRDAVDGVAVDRRREPTGKDAAVAGEIKPPILVARAFIARDSIEIDRHVSQRRFQSAQCCGGRWLEFLGARLAGFDRGQKLAHLPGLGLLASGARLLLLPPCQLARESEQAFTLALLFGL